MKRQTRWQMKTAVHSVFSYAVMAVTLLAASACTSKVHDAQQASDVKDAESGATRADADPGIDLDCIYKHLQNPPDSFHYVYKKNESDGFSVHQEADVTPQTIDGFRLQPDGTPHPLHAARSDVSSWQAALAGLTGISGMAGTVTTFNHNSAMQRESDSGLVNGYETIHYSIDTARWDETTRQILGAMTVGPGGFDKGDAWVTKEGCPVKLILDDEMHKKDGSLIEKVHYEESMMKK